MGSTKLLRTACLTVAGVATAWAATPAAAEDYTVDVASNATMEPAQSLSNPHFLYVSNTSPPVPGIAALPSANFAPLTNPTSNFSVIGHDDGDSPFFYAITYTIVGLAPNGDLVAGLNALDAANVIAANSSFDSIFGAGSEALLLAALNPTDNTNLTSFAQSINSNPAVNQYTYFNQIILVPSFDPKIDSLTLVDFGHVSGNPSNSQVGVVNLSLSTQPPVPEPASLAILAAPALFLLARRRRP